LTQECGRCHGPGLIGGWAGGDVDDSYDTVTDANSGFNIEDIIAEIDSGDMPADTCGGGDPGDQGCVSEADYDTITEWADSGNPPPP
jgi:hypothetical protein